MRTGKERRDKARSGIGEPDGKCRYCGKTITDPKRLTFCNEVCVHLHNLRTNERYVRKAVEMRDHGKCAQCGLDCEGLRTFFKTLCAQLSYDPINYPQSLPDARLEKFHKKYPWFLPERSAWEADHIKPVAEGGLWTDLDNLQTLCLACHGAKTRAMFKKEEGENDDDDL